MPRPTLLIDWGTAPTEHAEGTVVDDTKDVIVPSTAYQQAGWTAALGGPVRQFVNWCLRNTSEWLEYLRDERDDHETRVADIEGDALLGVDDRTLTDLTVGRPYWLAHETAQPGAKVDGAHITTHAVVALCSDGEYVWVADSNGDVSRYSADGLTLDADWSWSAPSGTIRAIACAGDDVYVAADATMYRVDRDDETTTNSRTLGANITHLATNGVSVFAVSSTTLSRHSLALGAATASHDHGAAIGGIAVSHDRVHLAGDAGSAATLGGSYGYISFDLTLSTHKTYHGSGDDFTDVAADGKRVFVADVNQVFCLSVHGNQASSTAVSALWSSETLGANLAQLVVTGRDVVAYDSTQNRIYGINAASGAAWWSYDGSDATGVDIDHLAADAYGIVVGGSNDVTDHELARVSDGHDGRLVARRSALDAYRHPYHQLLVPID